MPRFREKHSLKRDEEQEKLCGQETFDRQEETLGSPILWLQQELRAEKASECVHI